jgi:hypothetical protein
MIRCFSEVGNQGRACSVVGCSPETCPLPPKPCREFGSVPKSWHQVQYFLPAIGIQTIFITVSPSRSCIADNVMILGLEIAHAESLRNRRRSRLDGSSGFQRISKPNISTGRETSGISGIEQDGQGCPAELNATFSPFSCSHLLTSVALPNDSSGPKRPLLTYIFASVIKCTVVWRKLVHVNRID